MPFSRPTLTTLRAQAEQDVVAATQGGGTLLRKAVLRILAWVQAGLAHLHYGYLDWIARQAVPFTATDEYLEGWAGLKAVTRKPATAAQFTVTFAGTNGTVLPAGSSVVRQADGAAYTTNADATVASGTVTPTVTAAIAGADGNSDVGVAMVLGQAVAGIQSGGTVAAVVVSGADVEDVDAFRSRMLQVYQAPPQGGAKTDYVEWSEAVAGVTRAWVAPNGMGVGTVVVYVMLDEAESAHGGFPQGTNGVATSETRGSPTATGDQLTVANALYPLQPVTALVYVVAPVATAVNFTISNIASGLRTAVSNAISDLFLRNGSPGGVTLMDGSAGGTIELKDVWAAINSVAGTSDFLITSPAADITMAAGHLPTLGTITWT